jgi:hypothetical protein
MSQVLWDIRRAAKHEERRLGGAILHLSRACRRVGFALKDGIRPAVDGGGPAHLYRPDPSLGPLQDNGGPTQTPALLNGSPAIDAGNPGGCTDNLGAILSTDQRGYIPVLHLPQDPAIAGHLNLLAAFLIPSATSPPAVCSDRQQRAHRRPDRHR